MLYLKCHRATHVTRGSGSLQCHPQHCAFGGALGSPPGRGTPASGASFGGCGSRGRPQCHPGLKTGPREGLLRAGWARSCENSPQRGPRPWEGICLCSREGSAACPAQREARCSAPGCAAQAACQMLTAARLSLQPRGLQVHAPRVPAPAQAWGCQQSSVLPLTLCLSAPPTGRDPENNQEALQDFKEIARARGLALEIFIPHQSGRRALPGSSPCPHAGTASRVASYENNHI